MPHFSVRRLCLTVLAASSFALTGGRPDPAEVHRSTLLIDTHNDVTSLTVKGFDIGHPNGKSHTDLSRLRQGGVGAVFFAVYVDPQYAARGLAAHRALEMIDTVHHDIIERYPSDFAAATTAAGIETARRDGKIAALLGIEGGHAIENSLRLLRTFYGLGVRYMTLTHSNTNDWADSSGDMDKAGVQHHNGLTALGRDVVREMNRLGMLVDVSHVSDQTFWDALETSAAPVFASHSSCRALCNVPRNMSDDMILALAKKGGVIQINFYPGFLTLRKSPPASIEDVVAHIDHAVKIGGLDAVGIGSDFDGIDRVPVGLENVSRFPNLTRALLEKGYSAQAIQKIYGGNMLRVMRAAEATARRFRGSVAGATSGSTR
jgi:membrane dipeptidase